MHGQFCCIEKDFLLKKTVSFLGCNTTMHKTFLLIFFLTIIFCAKAQNNSATTTTIDSSLVINNNDKVETITGFAKDVLGDTTINFNDFALQRDTVSALKLKKEYSWTTNIDSFLLAKKKEDSSQSKFVITQNNSNSFLSSLFNSRILKATMWFIATALVLFIIYKLFLSEGVFGKRSAKAGINLQIDEEDTSLVNDYEKLLRKVYDDGNWRFAMRFLFLKTLQKLNEKQIIKYAVDKTNSVYVNELPVARRNDFASLALYYEYVWYGNVEIEKTVFDAIENKFNNFLNKI